MELVHAEGEIQTQLMRRVAPGLEQAMLAKVVRQSYLWANATDELPRLPEFNR